jgi:hypothetical protein
MLIVIMLNVVKLSVLKLHVIMLNVVAPFLKIINLFCIGIIIFIGIDIGYAECRILYCQDEDSLAERYNA